MTTALYLSDSYKKEMEATITEVFADGEKKWQVVLDQTVFYPMGGGQPTDQGTLKSESWQGRVYQVLQKGEKIVHFVESTEAPTVGDTVKGSLDWERRFHHMRLHSAGHVVDFAMHLLGLTPVTLMPSKGDHGKKPVIYYEGHVDKDFREELEIKANEIVKEGLGLMTAMVSFEELEKNVLYLQPGLPTHKPLRMLTLANVGSVADGGTQVNNTSEVGVLSILPIERKEGYTLVKYRLS